MTVIEQLQAARGLIERGWCQFAYARDRFGIPIHTNPRYEPDACRWCAVGALLCIEHAVADAGGYLMLAVQKRGYQGVSEFNDSPGRTQAEVLRLFDDAIELAKAGEA